MPDAVKTGTHATNGLYLGPGCLSAVNASLIAVNGMFIVCNHMAAIMPGLILPGLYKRVCPDHAEQGPPLYKGRETLSAGSESVDHKL